MISNVPGNLRACYAYAVIFICRFGEGFVLPFQRASFIRYFTSGFCFYNFNFYVSPMQIKYISGRRLFIQGFFVFM